LLFGVMWLVGVGVAGVLISIAAWLWPKAGDPTPSDPVTVGGL
jgi:hypothetical protein